MITITITERFIILTVVLVSSFLLGVLTRKQFNDWFYWFKHTYILKWCREIIEKDEMSEAIKRQQNQNLDKPCEWEILSSGGILHEELEVEPDGIIQPKGVTILEIAELKYIMQGSSASSDLDSAIVVAKMQNTILFDQLQAQIKGAKQNLSLLIDRVDQKIQHKNDYKEGVEEYFYENTGFSIRDFLPNKSA